MTFISYAQNYEDVMLWRALKHIENGFYIDVGAAWPKDDSVTFAFYEKKWSGINVEPNPAMYKELCEARERDINLEVAVGDAVGASMEMCFFDNGGLSTLDSDIAEMHIKDGHAVNRLNVNIQSLCQIWSEYVPYDQDVHFLKVDVEGYEGTVLKSNDWEKNRPWIVVIEATLPLSQEENHSDWEGLLLDNQYCFVYADGLNRFYVAQEHSEFLDAFKYPPNVFDEFTTSTQKFFENRTTKLQERAHKLAERAEASEFRANETEHALHELRHEMQQLAQNHASMSQEYERVSQDFHNTQQVLKSVHESTSWYITAPLRKLGDYIRSAKAFLYSMLMKVVGYLIRVLQRPISILIRQVAKRPALKARLIVFLQRFPGLSNKLKSIATGQVAINSSTKLSSISSQKLSSDNQRLSPNSKKIYSALKKVVNDYKEEK